MAFVSYTEEPLAWGEGTEAVEFNMAVRSVKVIPDNVMPLDDRNGIVGLVRQVLEEAASSRA